MVAHFSLLFRTYARWWPAGRERAVTETIRRRGSRGTADDKPTNLIATVRGWWCDFLRRRGANTSP